MSLISQGLAQNLIKFDDENKYITYVHQNKKRNFANPEEQVQTETFLKLILTYGYAPKRLRLFVPVTMGSSVKEADIIVYNDDACLSSHIVVECKKQEVSELEFTQAVEQAFSYAVAEGAKYVWITSGIKDQYFQVPIEKPKERIAITDIPQYGVDKLARYKYAKGGGKSNGQKLFELEIVGEDELTRRFKQAHQSLWGGGELNPSSAFDELDKLIFCKIWDEKKSRKKGQPYDFQLFSISDEEEPDPKKRTEKENDELSDRIKALYEEGRKEAPEVFKEDIRLSPERLRTVVGYLESINLGKTDLDSKGRAFETFMGSFFRGDFGQYFTPRPIVKFIVDVLPINHNSLVLDTSCGSGGFLLHALDKVRRQADEYYPEYETDLDDAKRHKDHWHRFASRKLFGIEINEQIARVAKMNMIIHDDGYTNVIASDGLRDSGDLIERSGNSGFEYDRFDFIITNPPFGSVIKQTEQAYMHQYGFAMKTEDWLNPKSKATVRENQNTEILFIEQCHRFLVDGGYLAMVVPDGILTNSSLQYVRDGIEEKYRIVAVVSMPQTAFSATGAGVKSSVLFLKKYSQAETTKIKNTKVGLQDWIKQSNDYVKQLEQIENDKKRHLKDLRGFENPQNLAGKALTDSEVYKEWRKEVTAEYSDRIDALKESLSEQYAEEKQKVLNDYPIFMAIAEDIGYDATGKPTNNNELDFISVELVRFIEAIESGNDSFFLGSDVDKNKIFIVSSRNIIARLDPVMILYERNNNDRFKYKAQYLASLLKGKPQYGANEAGKVRLSCQEPRYIRITDIDEYGLLKDDISVTAEVIETQYLLNNNDILFARSGATVGKTYIHKANAVNYPCFFAGYMIRFVIDESKAIPDYIFAYTQLNLYRKWVIAVQRAAGQPNINSEEYKSLKIPIPPIDLQNKVVAKMDDAYALKKRKELEAQRSLDSIDDYLLSELGINLVEPEENTIQSRIFYRKLSEVSGSRFDAPAYRKNLSLLSNIFPMEKFKNCVFINPLTLFHGIRENIEATFIPMECVSDIYGEADTTQTKNTEESTGYTQFLENDLIWAKITPCMQNGKSAVVSNLVNGIGFGSTEFHVFRAKPDIDIRYIHSLLRLKILRYFATLYFSGSAGHQRVTDEFFVISQ